ncbi:MAG: hypothetical protein DSY43_06880 [Gammaproteobacteria bacterium]|nr:MAG: hypothetical protein DSY43_06880 [Gammaproteobacteria bacterium]
MYIINNKRFIIGLFALLSFFTFASEIPNPLSLEQALKIGEKHSSAVQKQQLNIDENTLNLETIQSKFDLKSTVDLQLARRDDYANNINDSHTFIHFEKVLFEQNANINADATQQKIINTKQNLVYIKKENKIEIMRRFFDVILVDMQLETTLERLAISAIRANNVKDDFDINKASEVELLQKQASTQLDVSQRIKIEAQQILKRAELADILGVSYENRPDDLVKPELKHYFNKPITALDVLRKNAFKNNTVLQIMQQNLSSLKHQFSRHKGDYGVIIKSNVRIGEQAYLRDKYGNLRYGVNLTMPFGTNNVKQQTIAKLNLKIKQIKIEIEQFKRTLSSQVFALWIKLNELKQIHKSLTTELEYRDLYLERARAKYELELASDIGEALTQFTNTEYKLSKNQFDFVIAFEKLALLTGEIQ